MDAPVGIGPHEVNWDSTDVPNGVYYNLLQAGNQEADGRIVFAGMFLTDENGESQGVEAQINMAISDEMSSRFGSPDGTNINTVSMATATFYF